MSTDYRMVCYTCKTEAPEAFASASGFYGYKVWASSANAKWLGHGEAVGHHEGHDLRIVSEHVDLPWELGEDPAEAPTDSEGDE